MRGYARLQVVADEFSLTLSRQAVAAGPVLVEYVNFGEDDHDLLLRRAGALGTYRFPKIRPGARVQKELRLRRGRYVFWCGVGGHRGRGMSAPFVVR